MQDEKIPKATDVKQKRQNPPTDIGEKTKKPEIRPTFSMVVIIVHVESAWHEE